MTEQNELLLTVGEQRPFVEAKIVGYGDVEVTEEHWDIDGLLKAQLAKVLNHKEDTVEAKSAFNRHWDKM